MTLSTCGFLFCTILWVADYASKPTFNSGFMTSANCETLSKCISFEEFNFIWRISEHANDLCYLLESRHQHQMMADSKQTNLWHLCWELTFSAASNCHQRFLLMHWSHRHTSVLIMVLPMKRCIAFKWVSIYFLVHTQWTDRPKLPLTGFMRSKWFTWTITEIYWSVFGMSQQEHNVTYCCSLCWTPIHGILILCSFVTLSGRLHSHNACSAQCQFPRHQFPGDSSRQCDGAGQGAAVIQLYIIWKYSYLLSMNIVQMPPFLHLWCIRVPINSKNWKQPWNGFESIKLVSMHTLLHRFGVT